MGLYSTGTTPVPPSGGTGAGLVSLIKGWAFAACRTCRPVLLMLILMWMAEASTWIFGRYEIANALGVHSWEFGRFWAVFTSPFAHGSLMHLSDNSFYFLLFGCWASLAERKFFWPVTALISLISGLGAFALNAPGTLTIGASGLVFGYFAFILARAVVNRSFWAILGASTIALIWGSTMLVGLLNYGADISWQGHLFGVLGGIAAAMAVSWVQNLGAAQAQ